MPELHVVSAGSLLEFVLNSEGFRMPVGRVQFMHMYPMTLKEFLSSEYAKELTTILNKIEPLIFNDFGRTKTSKYTKMTE